MNYWNKTTSRLHDFPALRRIGSTAASLAALFVLATMPAFAQTVVFNLGTAPTQVASTGRSEVMGQVSMAAEPVCSPGGLAAEPPERRVEDRAHPRVGVLQPAVEIRRNVDAHADATLAHE